MMNRGQLQGRVSIVYTLLIVVAGVLAPKFAVAGPVPLLPLDPATDLADSSPVPGKYYGFNETNINGTFAWIFQVLQPVRVMALGWYDDGADGLSNSHPVGLSVEDTLSRPTPIDPSDLLSVTIPSGASAPLLDSYRIVRVPTLVLEPGSYVISGWDYLTSPDVVKWVAYPPADPRVSTAVQPLTGGYDGAHVSLALYGAYLGPMIFVAPVPEPKSATIAIVAVLVGAVYWCWTSPRLTLWSRQKLSRQKLVG